ncbi:MAG: T9SS type A sorting domain-containing protein [Rhodothermales bacterium]
MKYVSNAMLIMLMMLVPLSGIVPVSVFAQKGPVSWVMTAGSSGDDYAGRINVLFVDGSTRFAGTMGIAGGDIGDVFVTPARETAFATEIDPDSGRPLELYFISADDKASTIRGEEVMVDAKENVLLAGSYEGSVGEIDHDIGVLETPLQSVYLAQFTEKGTVSWMNTIGARTETGMASYGAGATHANGEIYLTGSYTGNNVIFSSTGNGVTLSSPTGSDEDAFLAIYDTEGLLLDWTLMQGSGDSKGNTVAVDIEGTTMYWGGDYTTVATLGRNILEAAGKLSDGFLVKFVKEEVAWIMDFKGEGNQRITDVVIDPKTGGGYFAGYFEGNDAKVQTGDEVVLDFSNIKWEYGSFIGCFSPEGKIEWVSVLSEDALIYDLVYRPETPDLLAGVSVVGSFAGESFYGGPNAEPFALKGLGGRDGMMLEIDAKGNLVSLPLHLGTEPAAGIPSFDTEIVSMDLNGDAGSSVGVGTFQHMLDVGDKLIESRGGKDIFVFGYDSELAPPLPVELVSFDVLADGTAVYLQWETAGEVNNAGFEVQHKSIRELEAAPVNTTDWETLDFMPGYGTTSDPQSYTYSVTNLPAGVHHFRLKQIDFDGRIDYSPIAIADLSPTQLPRLMGAYPNPFVPATTIRFSVPEPEHVSITIFDVTGREVHDLVDQFMQAGTYSIPWDATGMASGMYLYRLRIGAFSTSKHMLLTK